MGKAWLFDRVESSNGSIQAGLSMAMDCSTAGFLTR